MEDGLEGSKGEGRMGRTGFGFGDFEGDGIWIDYLF
jgi:hypothetical protein